MSYIGANSIHDSRGINTSNGERKLRTNLLNILRIEGVDRKHVDVLNQFFIAVSGGVERYENSKKTALLPGRVAVKIGEEEMQPLGGGAIKKNYVYIFLNLNSLSKRLDIDKKTLKDAEANGNLNEVIIKRVKDLAKEQELVDSMLGEIANGTNVFQDKNVEIPMTIYKKSGPVEVRFTKQDIMKKFIEEHFSDDDGLMEDLEGFLANPVTEDRLYLKHLVSKLWWEPKSVSLQNKKEFALEKYSAVSKPAFNLPLANFFHGIAAARSDNKGTREISRVTFFEWDTDRRYGIALEDDFIYTSIPIPRSSNEVPLELPGNEGLWVLVNKNSLKRLGIDKDVINKAMSGTVNDLTLLVKEQIDKINEASDLIKKIESSFERDNFMNRDFIIKLNELMTNYPDEMFKEITADFLKKAQKDGFDIKENKKEAYEFDEEVDDPAKEEFKSIIKELKKNHLVDNRKV